MNTSNKHLKLNVIFLVLLLLANFSIPSRIHKSKLKNSDDKPSIRSILGLPKKTDSDVQTTSFLAEESSQSEGKPLENSGYLLFGYNLHTGNPHSLNGSVDPGFTAPIFQSDFSQNLKTGDLRFLIPNGVTFAKNVGCDVSLSNKEIKGLQSYKDTLEADVSIGGGFWGVSFSASASYKHISEGSKSNNKVFIEQKADCRVYQGQINYFKPPAFDETFVTANKFLSETTFEESSDDFYEFINFYGTHFLDKLTMGARYGYLNEMSLDEYSIFKSHEGKISAEAGYKDIFKAGASFGMGSANTNSGSSSSSSTRIFSVGANPPADGNTLTWASNAIAEPMPIKYSLRTLLSIFTNRQFNLSQFTKQDIDLKKLAANLTKAYQSYCPNYLRPKGEAKICVAAEIPNDLQVADENLINISLSSVSIKNWGTNLCLDSNGPSVVSNPCKMPNDRSQLFQFYGYMDTMMFLLANIKNSILTRTSNNGAAFGNNVGGPSQNLHAQRMFSNTYYIKIGDHCLESSSSAGAQVYFRPCNQSRNQRWLAYFQ